MKPAALLAVTLLAAPVMGAEVDPRLLRVIGSEAALIFGTDIERYQNSRLSEFYPVRLDDVPGLAEIEGSRTIRQLIFATDDLQRASTLILFQSASPLSFIRPPQSSEVAEAVPYRGIVLHAVNQASYFALLDTTVGVVGDEENVHLAIDRWNQKDSESREIEAKVRQLSQSYDNWFLAIKPLVSRDEERPASVFKHRDDFIRMIEEVRGGIRLGGLNEVSLEAVVKTADDATGLAAIGRWLPGIIQIKGSGRVESAIADLADNLDIRASGRVVSLSFLLAETKLDELAKSLKAPGAKEPK
jgi:hypothetical protein